METWRGSGLWGCRGEVMDRTRCFPATLGPHPMAASIDPASYLLMADARGREMPPVAAPERRSVVLDTDARGVPRARDIRTNTVHGCDHAADRTTQADCPAP